MPAKVRGASGGVNWRRLAIRLHLWGGLLTGPFLLVLGLSGAALVFRTEIESLESATPAVASSGPGAVARCDRRHRAHASSDCRAVRTTDPERAGPAVSRR